MQRKKFDEEKLDERRKFSSDKFRAPEKKFRRRRRRRFDVQTSVFRQNVVFFLSFRFSAFVVIVVIVAAAAAATTTAQKLLSDERSCNEFDQFFDYNVSDYNYLNT